MALESARQFSPWRHRAFLYLFPSPVQSVVEHALYLQLQGQTPFPVEVDVHLTTPYGSIGRWVFRSQR